MEIESENSEPAQLINNACRNHRDSNKEKKLLDRLSRHDSDSHHDVEEHSRDENSRKNSKKMLCLMTVTFLFFVVELVAGLLNRSVALLADSYHMLSDVMALFIALVCLRISMKKSKKNGFGWVRAEVFGAAVNGVFLLSTCFLITLEAFERIYHPKPMTHPTQVLAVGIIGFIINLIGMSMFHGSHGHSHGGSGGHGHSHGGGGGHGHSHGHVRIREDPINAGEALELCSQEDEDSKVTRPSRSMSHLSNTCSHNHLALRFVMEDNDPSDFDSDDTSDAAAIAMKRQQEQENLNMRGLFLHIVSDAIGSVFVIITATLAIFFHEYLGDILYYLDPGLSLILVSLISFSAVRLVRETADIILGRPPKFIDQNALKKDMAKVQGVAHVGAISIWTLVASRHLATAEVIFCNAAVYEEALPKLRKIFHGMGIHSLTVDPIFSQERCDVSEVKATSEEGLCEDTS
ncbi:unnamed protein product [Auanema sp. JU1783]|nr:unnamed protein product [Auanema sp. JU1783]